MQIENRTTYTKENVLRFHQIHFHYTLKRWEFVYYGVIALLIFLAFFFFHDLFFRSLSLLGALFIFFQLKTNMIPNLKVKQLIKNQQIELGKNHYTFLDQALEVETQEKSIVVPYQELYLVLETKEALYLYCDPHTVYLIDKKGFKKGEKKVEKKLQEQVIDRYHFVKTR